MFVSFVPAYHSNEARKTMWGLHVLAAVQHCRLYKCTVAVQQHCHKPQPHVAKQPHNINTSTKCRTRRSTAAQECENKLTQLLQFKLGCRAACSATKGRWMQHTNCCYTPAWLSLSIVVKMPVMHTLPPVLPHKPLHEVRFAESSWQLATGLQMCQAGPHGPSSVCCAHRQHCKRLPKTQ